jgi:acyl-CoA thioesterase
MTGVPPMDDRLLAACEPPTNSASGVDSHPPRTGKSRRWITFNMRPYYSMCLPVPWVRLRRVVAKSDTFLRPHPFILDLGVEFLESGDGRSRVALQLTERHLNGWSVAHGGVIMTLLDVAMAVAGRSLDPNAGGGVTVEMKTSFLQPGLAGSRLIATGHAFHQSRTMAFCQGDVHDTEGRAIARSMGTFKYIRKRPTDQPADA